ncbi:hypothetical protein OGAPHI_005645 [Ogataea philodendri]|uniref:BHLH domain-containing protein n=1 Tax=Ogataea philodendri TaxID=1378263 RepID=A0A9P8NY59_9ASCO|nr:uncharacterized protein OGAPHI_005645 [Ogataea philodendri]KAH3662393.1 hypothetical protein OGAPHI_005645 [Ogataea philodendri]
MSSEEEQKVKRVKIENTQPEQPSESISGLEKSTRPQIPTMTVPQSTTLPLEPTLKPTAGSEEWHTWRKNNHKEVEKRRRETINQGIKELQELLPTQDHNKSQILKRAVEYIKRLKENEDSNIEKWTLEKLITDQAVSELANSNEKLKAELEKTYREAEGWRRAYNQSQEELAELKKRLKK